jgi:hypothetical protein
LKIRILCQKLFGFFKVDAKVKKFTVENGRNICVLRSKYLGHRSPAETTATVGHKKRGALELVYVALNAPQAFVSAR